jgi:hypothetical protein
MPVLKREKFKLGPYQNGAKLYKSEPAEICLKSTQLRVEFISQPSLARKPTIDTRQSPGLSFSACSTSARTSAPAPGSLCYAVPAAQPFQIILLSVSLQAPTATVGLASIILAMSATRRYDCSRSACS